MVMEVRDVKLLFSKAMNVNYIASLSELKRSDKSCVIVAISPHYEMTNALVGLCPVKYALIKAIYILALCPIKYIKAK
jgi:hypothetical protein